MSSIIQNVSWRPLQDGQVSELRVADASSGASELVLADAERVLESPNWFPDDSGLLVNSAGRLYRVPFDRPELVEIDTPGLADHNNDHQLSPDGSLIYSSSEGDGHIYAIPVEGGTGRRVTPERSGMFSHFLQGVSADGGWLHYSAAYGSGAGVAWELRRIRVDGSCDELVASFGGVTIGFEETHAGERFFCSDHDSRIPGTMRLFREHTDGREDPRPLTDEEHSSWFPKLAPDGSRLVFVRFPAGSVFHPANVPVDIVRMDQPSGLVTPLLSVFGGQGTMNMNSWSPDGDRFAYMAYPMKDGAGAFPPLRD